MVLGGHRNSDRLWTYQPSHRQPFLRAVSRASASLQRRRPGQPRRQYRRQGPSKSSSSAARHLNIGSLKERGNMPTSSRARAIYDSPGPRSKRGDTHLKRHWAARPCCGCAGAYGRPVRVAPATSAASRRPGRCGTAGLRLVPTLVVELIASRARPAAIDDVEPRRAGLGLGKVKTRPRRRACAEDRAVLMVRWTAGFKASVRHQQPVSALPEDARAYPEAIARRSASFGWSAFKRPVQAVLSADAYPAVSETRRPRLNPAWSISASSSATRSLGTPRKFSRRVIAGTRGAIACISARNVSIATTSHTDRCAPYLPGDHDVLAIGPPKTQSAVRKQERSDGAARLPGQHRIVSTLE